MRPPSPLAFLVTLALMAAACTSDGGGEETTTAPEGETTTTAPPVEPSTTAAGSLSLADYVESFSDDPSDVCYFSQYHLFAPNGEGDAIVDLLGDEGIASINGYVVDPVEAFPDSLTEVPLEDDVDIVTISPENVPLVNPYLIVQWLRNEKGQQANLVYAVGMAGHWQLKPGNDAMPADPGLLWVPPGEPTRSDYIAVVDSGLVDTRLAGQAWVLDGVVDAYGDAQSTTPLFVDGQNFGDNYGLSYSHGTFIVSLIRQIAPEANVIFAGIGGWEKDAYFNSWPQGNLATFDATAISHEVDAYSGIRAIIERFPDVAIRALNLSWGTYPCEAFVYGAFGQDELNELVALQSTLAAWDIAFPDAPVFAAGGNEEVYHGPFLPAAVEEVLGIGATADAGANNAIVWDDNGQAVAQPAGSGQFFAAGCDLVGVGSDNTETAVIAWGGSSFATPVASASWVLAGTSGPFDQQLVTDQVPLAKSSRC